jgi:hypothetical protein
MMRWVVVFLGLFLLAAEDGTAVSVEFQPQEARLGEAVKLIITAKGEEGVEYRLPEQIDLGAFVELGREREKKGERYIFTLKVVVYEEVGDVAMPGFELIADKPGTGTGAGTGTIKALEVPEAKLTIKSMLTGVEKPEPRDIAGPVAVWVRDYRLLVYLGLVLLFTFGAWILKRSRPGGRAEQRLVELPPARLAHQIAYDKLHKIVEDELLKKGEFREYFIRVSETVREYLGNRYGFFAMDLTSRELVDELRDRPTPGLEMSGLKTLLQDADLVKFAKLEPTDEMSSSAIDGAYSLVNATRRVEEEDADRKRETA